MFLFWKRKMTRPIKPDNNKVPKPKKYSNKISVSIKFVYYKLLHWI